MGHSWGTECAGVSHWSSRQGYIEERKDRGKGVYRLRVDAGEDPVTGKRRQLSRTIRVTGPRPKQQAEQRLREL